MIARLNLMNRRSFSQVLSWKFKSAKFGMAFSLLPERLIIFGVSQRIESKFILISTSQVCHNGTHSAQYKW